MKKLITLLFLLGGCATEQQYARNVATWNDRSADELVSKWGMPTRTMILPSGNTLYVYDRSESYTSGAVQMPGTSTVTNNPYAPGGAQYVTSQPGPLIQGTTIVSWCSTFFEIDASGQVLSVRYQGNNCTAR